MPNKNLKYNLHQTNDEYQLLCYEPVLVNNKPDSDVKNSKRRSRFSSYFQTNPNYAPPKKHTYKKISRNKDEHKFTNNNCENQNYTDEIQQTKKKYFCYSEENIISPDKITLKNKQDNSVDDSCKKSVVISQNTKDFYGYTRNKHDECEIFEPNNHDLKYKNFSENTASAPSIPLLTNKKSHRKVSSVIYPYKYGDYLGNETTRIQQSNINMRMEHMNINENSLGDNKGFLKKSLLSRTKIGRWMSNQLKSEDKSISTKKTRPNSENRFLSHKLTNTNGFNFSFHFKSKSERQLNQTGDPSRDELYDISNNKICYDRKTKSTGFSLPNLTNSCNSINILKSYKKKHNKNSLSLNPSERILREERKNSKKRISSFFKRIF